MSPSLCYERTPAAVEYMEGFFAQYRSVLPFLVSGIAMPADGRERGVTTVEAVAAAQQSAAGDAGPSMLSIDERLAPAPHP